MKKRIIVAAAIMGISFAASAADYKRLVDYRQSGFTIIGWNMGTVGAMARGKVAFDQARFSAAAERIAFMSNVVDDTFVKGSMGGSSAALLEIEDNWDDFNAKLEQFQKAASALNTKAKNAKSIDDVKAEIGALGKSCKGCHDSYKAD